MVTIYQWLIKYQTLQRAIEYLEFEIEEYELELKRWVGGNLSDVRITKQSKGAKIENILHEKNKELKVLQDRKERLIEFIYKLDDLDSEILIKRYIEEKKLVQIATEMNYSESYIYKKHSELIKKINLIEKFAQNLT